LQNLSFTIHKDKRLRIKIKFPIDSTVEDFISKIRLHTNTPSKNILVSRLAFSNRQFKFVNMRRRGYAENLFSTRKYSETYLVRFGESSDDSDEPTKVPVLR
jgi:hypothetical protein